MVLDPGNLKGGVPIYFPNGPLRGTFIEAPQPPILQCFDPLKIGFLVIEETGKVITKWGLASSLDIFEPGHASVNSTIKSLVRSTGRNQLASSLIDEYRFFATPLPGTTPLAFNILVVEAKEEAEIRRRAAQSERKADALKKIGKALTMHQTLQPMTVAATHAISAATDVAAVLLWVLGQESGSLELVASVGANRSGTTSMAKIEHTGKVQFAAELAAQRQKPVIVPDVHQNPLTSEIEGRFCYLNPGGMMVWPLMIGNRLVGLLEVVSREDDSAFLENQDLFATIAEHMSLALNSTLMFENAEKLATYDPLTGIANHRTMQEFLAKRILESERSNSLIGVIMLDVDHFRKFNEEEGHDAGDRVLKLVANVIKNSVRPYDLGARYGGEEFTVVMPGVNAQEALVVAERIRKRISEIEYFSANGTKCQITASLGVSLYPHHGQESASLLKTADLALYEAKRLSRNRVVLYQGSEIAEDSKHSAEQMRIARTIVPSDLLDQCEKYLKRLVNRIGFAASELNLSTNQFEVLRAAAYLFPLWQRFHATGDREGIEKLKAHHQIKPVISILIDSEEMFNGNGPKKLSGSQIPLLARVLVVLQAHAQGWVDPLDKVPGKYDPNIVELVYGSGIAA